MVQIRQEEEVRTLIDALLDEQARLQTPVAEFSRNHTAGAEPGLKPVYRNLIPLSAPGPEERYAFEVDLDSCTGCKACVAGCHSLNGLDEDETWRDVGWLVDAEGSGYQQTVTSACHHCADPGCLNGCPVLAYELDPKTGIVRHLDDQCIGCSYCILKCPYDVPKFNKRLGIVRKCDMCHSRLSQGEAPACVQACPTEAIRITKVSRTQADVNGSDAFLNQAPDPAHTKPTTRYFSRRGVPTSAVAADLSTARPQHAHPSLAILLVLSQLALGAQLAGSGRSALVLLAASGVAGALHLGQPLRAWRVFLGWRRSWLSREALGFGLWFSCLAGSLVLHELNQTAAVAAMWGAAVVGCVSVVCSAAIYADTPRRAWSWSRSLPLFLASVCVGASAIAGPGWLCAALLSKAALEWMQATGLPPPSRLAWEGPLRRWVNLQRFLRGLSILTAALSLYTPAALYAALPLALAAELIERLLFFMAVDPSSMPGQPGTPKAHA